MESKGSTPRPRQSNRMTTRVVLGTLLAIHCILHIVLFVVSCIAWSALRKQAKGINCDSATDTDCRATYWTLYNLTAAAALTCASTLATVAVRTCVANKGAPVDSLYVFRVVVLTTLLLMPFMCLGWPDMQIVVSYQDQKLNTDPTVASMLDDPRRTRLGVIAGTFVLEILDSGLTTARVASALTYFNVFQGAWIAGLSAALAPMTRVPVGSQDQTVTA